MQTALNCYTSNMNSNQDWPDHTNSFWALKNCDDILQRDYVQNLYETLISNKEITVNQTPIYFSDDLLHPDFQYETVCLKELEYYINSLIKSQLNLAKHVCTTDAFIANLKQQLVVLKRIYFAICNKYHNRDKTKFNISPSINDNAVEPVVGYQALLELGVETGISFLFLFLQQNWQSNVPNGIPCSSILETAINIVDNLPPLSLSNDEQLTNLGKKCLEKVMGFLKDVILNVAGVDKKSRVLSAELLLGLAIQRGSLYYLLQWIDVGLQASARREDGNIIVNNKLRTKYLVCLPIYEKQLPLYDFALKMMNVIVEMATEYDEAFGTENLHNSEIINNAAYSEVYVWGSNSSQQLAKGSEEKLLTPAVSELFTAVQQV